MRKGRVEQNRRISYDFDKMEVTDEVMQRDTEEPANSSSTSLKDRSVQMIKNELVTCLENSMDNLQKIWNEIGIANEQKEERTQVVLKHLQTLLQEMVEEEEFLKATLLANVKTCSEDLEKLSRELAIVCPKSDEGLSILKLENELRTKVDELKLEKHERVKVYKALRDREKVFADRLCLPPHNLGQVVVPNKEEIKELQANIDYLQKELAKRLDQFTKIKSSILELWMDLEYTPQSTMEQRMAADNAHTSFELSAANMEILKSLQLELDHQHKANVATAAQLSEQVKSLWQKLEVDDRERSSFLVRWTGSRPSTIAALKEEKERLQALKLQHMQKFIEGLRKELITLWDKCCYGPAQRESFSPAFDTNYTEELLATHEHQVEVMKGFFEENKQMFKMVDKRETMFKKMEELELKQYDVNRFSNRGGALLKECRYRKALEKELPKLEKDLKIAIAKWEEENEQQFMVNGFRYSDLMDQQWDKLKTQKEQIKLDRHKRNHDIMKEELVYGSKPVTPVKKRFIGIGTPSKLTPNKKRRLDSTTASSMCQTPKSGKGGARRPPIGSSKKLDKVVKLSATKKKLTPRRISSRLKARRQVLHENTLLNTNKSKAGEKINTSVKMEVGSKTTSTKDMSMMSCVDYSDFALGLENMENLKNNKCRSSMAGTAPNNMPSMMSFV